MSVIIRLQNLPWSIDAQGIRQFFHGLSIPDGGVHIIGGNDGNAFITFSTDEDARRAMMKDRCRIENIPIRLFLSSKAEMRATTVSTYSSLLGLPFMGATLAEQFTQLTEQSKHSSGLTGLRSHTIPFIGNPFIPSVYGKDWPPEPNHVADIGIRPPSNKLVFSERHSPDAVTRSSSAENSLQTFSIEHGQLGVNKSSSLQRQKSGEKRGNSGSRMHEESAAKVTRLQNHRGKDGLDKASLLKEFAKINDDLYQCMKKLAAHLDTEQPVLEQESSMTRTGSEFTSRYGGHEFGHPEPGKEALGHNISCVSYEELFRSLHDAFVSCQNENKSRTIEGLFTGDVSRVTPSGARESRAIGSRDPRLLKLNTAPRSDSNLSIPGLEFIHNVLGQGLGLGLLNDIRLGASGSSLGVLNDNRGFEAGQGERRLCGEFPTFGHNERQSQIDRNFRDENPSLGLLGTPGSYEIAREFLDQLAKVHDAKGIAGKRQPCEISTKDIFSLRYGCGFWISTSNFPLTYGYREFRDFFSGRGIPAAGLKLVTDGFGKPTGKAYVKFNSHQAIVESLKLDGRVVDGCRVAVERCSEAEYEDAVDNQKPLISVGQGQSSSRSPTEQHIFPNKEKMVCAVVKNLSPKTTTKDIREYFSSSIIPKSGGPFMELNSDGQPKHVALVQFNSASDFEAALLKNRRCSLLNGAAVRVIEIKTGEFFYRLKRSRVIREKNVVLGKPRSTLTPRKTEGKEFMAAAQDVL